MDTENQDGEGLLGCLLLGAILFVGYHVLRIAVAIHEATWPIWLLFLVGGLGWRLAAKKPGAWSKAHVSVLMPVTLGLGSLFLVMLVLNLGGSFVSPAEIRLWEERLIGARLSLADWVNPSLPVFLIAVLGLLLLSRMAPRLKAVSIALTTQKFGSILYVVLVTVTSFTFFAQVPLQTMVEEEHARLKAEFEQGLVSYELLVRDEQEGLGQVLATRSVERALQDLNEFQKQQYRTLFEEVVAAADDEMPEPHFSGRSTSPWRSPGANETLAEALARIRAGSRGTGWGERARRSEALGKVAAQLGAHHADGALAQLPALPGSETPVPGDGQRPDSDRLAEPPGDRREWRAQVELLAQQDEAVQRQSRRTESASRLAQEARVGLEAVFCETVGLAVPKFQGIVGLYVDALVEQFSERLFKRYVEQQYTPGPKTTELRSFSERMLSDIARLIPVASLLKLVDLTGIRPESLRSYLQQRTQELVHAEVQESARREERRIAEERARREALRKFEAARQRVVTRTRARARGR